MVWRDRWCGEIGEELWSGIERGMSIKACLAYANNTIVQELCESRGGRPRLSVLTSLLVSVDVKNY